jgi:hypothetical protein
MECPRCGFIEQRDVQCPRCDGSFNAADAEEWAHLDYLEAKLGEWRDRELLPDQKVDELLGVVDAELTRVEEILGVKADKQPADARDSTLRSESAPAPDQDRILDAVDDALARGDTRQADRLLTVVQSSTTNAGSDGVSDERSEQFAPISSDVGLDMLFLVTDGTSESSEGQHFSRAIVYADSPEEAMQRVVAYIDLCNAADAAAAENHEWGEDSDVPDTSDEDQVEADSVDDSGPIGYDRDHWRATLVATTTARLDDEDILDAEHILIFETVWNE